MLPVIEKNEIVEINTPERKTAREWFCKHCRVSCPEGTCFFLRRFIEIEEAEIDRILNMIDRHEITYANTKEYYYTKKFISGHLTNRTKDDRVYVWMK
jgi:hypothetical protein